MTKNCLFDAVKLTKRVDVNLYKCSRYGITFNRKRSYSIGRNVIIFRVDMSSFSHIDNKLKDILILGKGPSQGLEQSLGAEKFIQLTLLK